MNDTVTLPKTEYEYLHRIAERYELLQTAVREDFFEKPPVHDAEEIVAAFKNTGRYSGAFLQSIARGLKHSSFFKSARER
jgi:hypothetical protein